MAKFKITVSTEKLGSKHDYIVNIDYDSEEMTDDELSEAIVEAMLQRINWSYTQISE